MCADLPPCPIFPSATNLRPLQELWLPGGFEDSLGVAGILDSKVPDSLSSFLRNLGVRQLTFEDYAERYVPRGLRKRTAQLMLTPSRSFSPLWRGTLEKSRAAMR